MRLPPHLPGSGLLPPRPPHDPKDLPRASGRPRLRSETQTALNRGALRAPSRTTLSEAGEAWLGAARAGVIRTRSGDPYKPSALRAYEQALAKLMPPSGT